MNFSNLKEPTIQKALRSHLTRNDIDIHSLLKNLNINIPKCGFCDNDISFRLAYIIKNNTISISGIIPGRCHKSKTPFYCSQKDCPGKKLNPNSIEFVSKAYNLSEKEALAFIHDRNKSPFYKTNHKNTKEYKISQSNFGFKQTKESIIKANLSRSIDGYKKKYGEDIGHKKYCQTQELKKNTIETFKERYGEVIGTKKWLQYKYSNSQVQLYTRDDLKKYVLSILEITPMEALKSTPPISIIESFHDYTFYKRCNDFNLKLEDVISDIFIDNPNLNVFDPKSFKKTKYGYFSYTENNTLLRSRNERIFYELLTTHGFKENIDFNIDKKYPNSSLRYDFYLFEKNIYVEIADMFDSDGYLDKMISKNKLFNSIILKPKDIPTFIEDLFKND